MKISTHLASFGIFLLSKQVAAQEPCSTQLDCPTNQYCNSNSNTCLSFGGCVTPADCDDENNWPYRMPFCLGTTICNELGTCDIDCGVFPDNDRVARIKCLNHSDCPTTDLSGDAQFCASDGFCETVGGCNAVEDCSLPENSFPMITCVGTLSCTDRQCSMKCDETEIDRQTDTSASCRSHDECPDSGYCASDGTCHRNGGCADVSDCLLPENQGYPIPACIGDRVCTNNLCGITCTESDVRFPEDPVPSEPAPEPAKAELVCTKDDDCNGSTSATSRSSLPGDMYCAAGTCKQQGTCVTDSDCINPSNFLFNDKRCQGFLFCDKSGQCDRECSTSCKDGSRMAQCFSNPCDTTDWKGAGASSCVLDKCNSECNTMLFDASGSIITDSEGETVTIDRDGSDTIERDGVDVMPWADEDRDETETCLSSKDCTEPDSYCNTSGFCASNGSCRTNEDCLSGDNVFMEIQCIGLKFCGEDGMCSKNCLSTVGNPCASSADCLDGEFCAGNNKCLASGSCETVADCVNAEAGLFFPECVGTIFCQENFCGKTCGGDSETVMDGFVPISVDQSALESSASRAMPILATVVALLVASMV